MNEKETTKIHHAIDLPSPESLDISTSTPPETQNTTVNLEGNSELSSTFTKKTDPRNYGSCYPFLYYKGEPLFLIGPDCKKISLKKSRAIFSHHGSRDNLLLGIFPKNFNLRFLSIHFNDSSKFIEINPFWSHAEPCVKKPWYIFLEQRVC